MPRRAATLLPRAGRAQDGSRLSAFARWLTPPPLLACRAPGAAAREPSRSVSMIRCAVFARGAARLALAVVLAALVACPRPSRAQDAPDGNWTFRRPVAVANAGATELTDYAVRIALDASFDFAHARSDGAD